MYALMWTKEWIIAATLNARGGLHTWAGFVASPTLRSAPSPPSVTAGWSVYGKRDETAICVALSQKTPSFKTFCSVQNKRNSHLMVSMSYCHIQWLNKAAVWQVGVGRLMVCFVVNNVFEEYRVTLSPQCNLPHARISFRPHMCGCTWISMFTIYCILIDSRCQTRH